MDQTPGNQTPLGRVYQDQMQRSRRQVPGGRRWVPRQTPQGLSLIIARGFLGRLLGLHGLPGLGPMQGLYLSPCRAIHTAGMRCEIDVVFLAADGAVLKCVARLKPWRCAACWRAHSVVELASGFCAAHPDYATQIRTALERVYCSAS